MESLQENALLYNFAAGIVVLVLFLLVLKFVESLAMNFLVIFIGVVIVGYGLMKFFPNVADPVTQFIGSNWTNDKKSNLDESDTGYKSDLYYDSRTYHDNSSIYNDDISHTYDSTYNSTGTGAYDNGSTNIYDDGSAYDSSRIYDGGNHYNDNIYDDSDHYSNEGISEESYEGYEGDTYHENNYNYENVGE